MSTISTQSYSKKESESVITRGKGQAGTSASATTTLTKATATAPVAVIAAVNRPGLGTTPPDTGRPPAKGTVNTYGK
jgi:hypothetical protein